MRVAFKIVSPSNTGAPDYDICGQSAPALSHAGMSVEIEFNGTVIYTVPNLSFPILPSLPIVVGSRTISAFTYHAVNGFAFTVDSFNTIGTEDTVKISLTKAGYHSFSNTFTLFDYDFSTNIYLINDTNNLDVNGYQTRAFSKFVAYRQPFTNKVYYYNVVGTQGTVSYYDVSDTLNILPLFTGQNGIVCADSGITIRQSISVSDVYGTLQDTCESDITVPYIQWFPIVNVSVDCSPACDETCISNIGTGKYTTVVDTTNLGCIVVDGESIYPYHYSPNINIVYFFYDYQGNEIGAFPANISLGACGTGCPESPFSLPLPTFPDLGDVILKVDFVVLIDNSNLYDSNILVKCTQSIVIKRCNWYSIKETDNCGEYIVSNCSVDATVLTISQLQEDKTLLAISTVPIPPLSSAAITLGDDGVYTFTVPGKVADTVETFVVIKDCNLRACLFTKLSSLICGVHDDKCIATIKDYYDFNAFVLNLHTYYALLNSEYNFNYIYTALDFNKLNDLYTIKQYLDNLSTYCVAACNTCNCGK